MVTRYTRRPRQYFFLKSKMHGKVLDINGGDASPGASIIVWEQKDSSSDNQLWYEDRHGYLHSKLNDLVMDSSGESSRTSIWGFVIY